MAKGKQDPNWEEKILAWKASCKSCRTWCQEHKIPYTTFCGWRSLFEKNKISKKSKMGFIELQDQTSCDSGISFEFKGITVHLRSEFNKTVLRQCIDCMRGLSC